MKKYDELYEVAVSNYGLVTAEAACKRGGRRIIRKDIAVKVCKAYQLIVHAAQHRHERITLVHHGG